MIGVTRLCRIFAKLISIFDIVHCIPIIAHLLHIISRMENSMRTYQFYLESKITNHPSADWTNIKKQMLKLRPNLSYDQTCIDLTCEIPEYPH